MWTGNLGVGANFGSEHESQAFKTNKQNKQSFGFKYTLLPLDLLIIFLLPWSEFDDITEILLKVALIAQMIQSHIITIKKYQNASFI